MTRRPWRRSLRAVARHEAAHAVVAVRLALPLTKVELRPKSPPPVFVPIARRVRSFRAAGYAWLDTAITDAWLAALPDPDAAEWLRRYAVCAATGVIDYGTKDDPGVSHDMQAMVQAAGYLGVGIHSGQPAVQRFIDDAIAAARAVLRTDDGVAWDRVTQALLRKRALQAAEVIDLAGV